MKILFIVPYVPNLIRVRPYNFIRSIAQCGHQVTVMCLWSTESEFQDAQKLKGLVSEVELSNLTRLRSMWNSIKALPSKTPLQAVYCWHPQFSQRIVEVLQGPNNGFDVVHVEHLRGAHYGLKIRERFPQMPVIWDSVDSISYLFRQATTQSQSFFGRWLTRLELGRTEGYEASLIHQFHQVVVTSRIDKQALLDLSSAKETPKITTIPNGVDLDYFTPDSEIERDPASIILCGKMSYHANITMVLYFVNKILPLIHTDRPDVKIFIVGKDPPREILALAQNPAITVTGTVDDMRVYLRKATISAVPLLYGAGIQNKVLEAMACETPVVSTPQAVAALEVVPGRDLLVAAKPEDFSQATLRLLANREQCQQIGQAGRTYVETHHDWADIVNKLETIYQNAINQTARGQFKRQ